MIIDQPLQLCLQISKQIDWQQFLMFTWIVHQYFDLLNVADAKLLASQNLNKQDLWPTTQIFVKNENIKP